MDYRERCFLVESSQQAMRLDTFLTHKITRLSRSQAQKCIHAGAVRIAPAREVKPALRLQAGEQVYLQQALYDDEPQYEDLRLIDENEDYWCFDKPAGMLVHPTARAYRNSVTVYIEECLGQRPYVVHRLDKESSGILLVAKSPEVSARLGAYFLKAQVQKKYLAVVYDPQGRYQRVTACSLTYPLGYEGRLLPNLRMGLGHLPARSELRVLQTEASLALLGLEPKTGRQHQLRVHLALYGTPILGDKLYFFGEPFYKSYLDNEELPPYLPHRHLLHAAELDFVWRQRKVHYESATPKIFAQTLGTGMHSAYLPTAYAQEHFASLPSVE